ncbi:hypothetical protein Sango_2429900 [Sesamum angolense]|uniref:Retrovirus-related Pol polyprotein from transposon TNT 1-94-like beta-barrel domain-containing protein n=1 Tax=Sesamum angolense TaxID=2727404 RepID=A0AAE2BK09_9LAMI|nr:hypothetical protein Sango_2429900 [Sesamum angolense]
MVSELLRLVKNRSLPSDPITWNYANYVQYEDEFAGNVLSISRIDLSCWIIDTGATNHICADITLFKQYSKPSSPQFIHLPDGTKKPIKFVGIVHVSPTLTLNHVLYIPDFSVNLLSVDAPASCPLPNIPAVPIYANNGLSPDSPPSPSSSPPHSAPPSATAALSSVVVNPDLDSVFSPTSLPIPVRRFTRENHRPA